MNSFTHTIERYRELLEKSANIEWIEQFYADDIRQSENNQPRLREKNNCLPLN